LIRAWVDFYQPIDYNKMTRVIGPMFSLAASGQIGRSIVYAKWRGISYARSYAIPFNPNSTDQGLIRDLIKAATQAWATEATVGAVTLNSTYKGLYATAAEGQSMSGFNMFVRDSVSKNWDSGGSPKYDGTYAAPTEPGDGEA